MSESATVNEQPLAHLRNSSDWWLFCVTLAKRPLCCTHIHTLGFQYQNTHTHTIRTLWMIPLFLLLLLLPLLNLHFNHLLYTLWYPLPLYVSAEFFPDILLFFRRHWGMKYLLTCQPWCLCSERNAHGKMRKLEHNMNVESTSIKPLWDILDMLIHRTFEIYTK